MLKVINRRDWSCEFLKGKLQSNGLIDFSEVLAGRILKSVTHNSVIPSISTACLEHRFIHIFT